VVGGLQPPLAGHPVAPYRDQWGPDRKEERQYQYQQLQMIVKRPDDHVGSSANLSQNFCADSHTLLAYSLELKDNPTEGAAAIVPKATNAQIRATLKGKKAGVLYVMQMVRSFPGSLLP